MSKHVKSEMTQFKKGQRYGLKQAAKLVEEFAKNYPEDVFPPIEPGCSPDRYSASMARHLCKIFHEMILKIDK